MRTERVPVGRRHATWLVASRTRDWAVPVRIAAGRPARFRGLAPAASDHGMVFRTRSVHGFGMRHSLGLVALDEAGTVLGCSLLRPRSVVTVSAAAWIVEVPVSYRPPAVGDEMMLLRRILAR